jgi:ATPases with chaperone activity, ATP-binding subunit
MSNEYKTKDIKIKELNNFVISVFEIPVKETNDKLAPLSTQRGIILKSMYDDFVIASCVANMNEFLTELSKTGGDVHKLVAMREELITKIFEINPSFHSDNIVINKNFVVKTKDTSSAGEPITKNKYWAGDVYKDSLNASMNKEIPKDTDKNNKQKNIKNLPYVPVQKFWKRIQGYVVVKQFNNDHVGGLLSGRTFNTRTSFEQYIVTVCIEEVEDLFAKLDKMGIPQHVAPPTLVHELYMVCKEVNPGIDFDLYKNDVISEDEQEERDPFEHFYRAASGQPEEDNKDNKKKNTRLFRNVSKHTLLNLDKEMKTKVIGQDGAISIIAEAIQRSSIGLKDPDQPIGAFIFAGNSGLGKTYTAKTLAEKLTGDKRSLVRIDCSEYSADHEYSKLIGAPAGYISHEQGGLLTNAIKKNPFSVILFDEIEKASDKVHQLLLQVMDDGRLTDGKGQTVMFKDAILIMTSNLGVKEVEAIQSIIGFGDSNKLTADKRVAALDESIKKNLNQNLLIVLQPLFILILWTRSPTLKLYS